MADGSDVKVTVTIEPEDARKMATEIISLRAELADVRAQWAADVGSAIARAQTAEARAERLNTEVGYLLEENEEMGRREMQRAAAARKVAQFARKNMAAMQHVQRAQRELDAARAEAARYAEALANSDPWTNDVPFNCVYCDAVWDSDIGSSENQHNAGCVWIAAAALRGPAQSEQPASCECGHRMTNHATADDGRRVCMILGCTCILPAARRQEANDEQH